MTVRTILEALTMTTRRTLLLAATASLILVTACMPQGPAPTTTASTTTSTVPTPTLSVVQTVSGFDRPWEVATAPDGTVFVTERPGRLAAVVAGARQVVATVPGVVAQGEGGLLGMALDPGFAGNRQVYLCHAAGSGGVVSEVRIVRYRIAEDLGSLTDAQVLLGGIPAGAGNRHLGCRLGFGPDGMLWATTGDAVLAAAPQDPMSRAGKVLRLTADGAPAPGNPGGAWDPYVYTLGHRNAQGLAFRPSDGAAFVTEHGTACDDEINLLVAGGNYGWNPVSSGGGYDENAPMTSPSIPGARPAVWSSGCPTIAPAGATFVQGAAWGPWSDQLAMAVLKGRRLSFVRIDGSTLRGVDDRVSDRGRLRAVAPAQGGGLWVAQDASPGSLLRLVPS